MKVIFHKAFVQRTKRNYRTGAGSVFADDYLGLTPPFVPANYDDEETASAIAFDTSTGNYWAWYSEEWHLVPIGGGVIGGGIIQGILDPTGMPPSGNGLFYNNVTGSVFIWNSRLGQWDQITAGALSASAPIPGGLGGAVMQGIVDPAGAPIGGNGLYYNNFTGVFFIWNSRLNQWDQITA